MDNEEAVEKTVEEEVIEEVVVDEVKPATEFAAEVVEESVETEPEAAEEPVAAEEEEVIENENSEGETVSFSLDDFQTLQGNYSELENRYNDLLTQFNSMKADYDNLVEFKKTKDIEEKQAMIDSFYMLSDEEKKEVQDNIENYTLDEIEGKLSVICVHNKLDLSEKKETEQEQIDTTFSLNNLDSGEDDFSAPAWVSLLRKNKKNEK